MSAKKEGEAALRALDDALAAKPKKDGHAFSEMTEHLCKMRDMLIGEHRANARGDNALERLNAIISTSLAGHFPLGNIPWDEVQHAREKLKHLISEV